MSHLNWRELSLFQTIEPKNPQGPRSGRDQFRLQITWDAVQSLIPHLEEVYLKEENELRVSLPNEWVLFFKKRESENRALLAHPQPGVWVTTVALERLFAQKWVDQMKSLAKGQVLFLSQYVPLGSVSNVDLVISIL